MVMTHWREENKGGRAVGERCCARMTRASRHCTITDEYTNLEVTSASESLMTRKVDRKEARCPLALTRCHSRQLAILLQIYQRLDQKQGFDQKQSVYFLV